MTLRIPDRCAAGRLGVTVRPTVAWLSKRAGSLELSRCIAEATEALLSDDSAALACFEGEDGHRSDSAATKIYALADPRSVIYDNRVGAAFARLVVEYLRHEGMPSLPDELRFMVAASRGRRNPSAGTMVFQAKQTGSLHATWNQRANWIIGKLADDVEIAGHLGVEPETSARRAIEAGLFVMGDDVRSLAVRSDFLSLARRREQVPEDPDPLWDAGPIPLQILGREIRGLQAVTSYDFATVMQAFLDLRNSDPGVTGAAAFQDWLIHEHGRAPGGAATERAPLRSGEFDLGTPAPSSCARSRSSPHRRVRNGGFETCSHGNGCRAR